MGEWVVGWMDGLMGRSCQITNNQINLDLIEIIQLCFQIYGHGDISMHIPPSGVSH